MYHNSILYHYETWSILFISTVPSLLFCGFSVQVSSMKLHPSSVRGRVPFLLFQDIGPWGYIHNKDNYVSFMAEKQRKPRMVLCLYIPLCDHSPGSSIRATVVFWEDHKVPYTQQHALHFMSMWQCSEKRTRTLSCCWTASKSLLEQQKPKFMQSFTPVWFH